MKRCWALSAVLLAALATQNSEAQEAELFAAWDGDASGSINAEELAGGMFGELDTDGDGALGESEVAAAPEGLALRFAAANANGDTAVDGDEFRAAIAAAGVFEDADVNGDGAIDPQEFAGFRGKWGRPPKKGG